VVVRFQGGDNAGHTVVNPLGEFKLHLVPSGIFNRGTQCIIIRETRPWRRNSGSGSGVSRSSYSCGAGSEGRGLPGGQLIPASSPCGASPPGPESERGGNSSVVSLPDRPLPEMLPDRLSVSLFS
jgi:hypothetical protein